MSSEIDLSLILSALRRRWWVVLICVVAALAIGIGIGLAQAQRYDATNILLVQSPRFQWSTEGAIRTTVDQRRDYQREIMAVARSAEIARAAAAALVDQSPGMSVTPQSLLSAITVRGGDGNTIVVSARSEDQERAAAFASAWTQELIAAARRVYGVGQDLTAFQQALDALELRLEESETALAQVRARTGLFGSAAPGDPTRESSVNTQQLEQMNETLAEYLLALQSLRLLQRELAEATADTELLQLPWELLDGPILSQRRVISAEVARAALDDPDQLLSLLRREESALQATSDVLQQEVTLLQAARAEDWSDLATVLSQRNRLNEAHQVLSLTVNLLAVQQQAEPSLLSIVGSPEPVVTHVRPPLIGLLATAAVAGLIVGVLAAVWIELSKRNSPR